MILTYGYCIPENRILAVCSCCSVYEATYTKTEEQAKIWLEIKFNEYKEKVTEDGKYFIHAINDDTFFVGEMKTNIGVELNKAVITALYGVINT